MKLVALPVFLTLFLVAALAINFSSAVFLYLLLNFLIWVVIFWSYKPCKEELELWPPSLPSCGEAYVNIMGENENSENAESSWDVAGDTYVNVKDDNSSTGSAAEIGWQDVDEQFDENLEKRIEEFIAKVNNGWRKEKLRDK
ncbi:hypothetical protein OIU76_015587 [Salix suchowensis]|nr:hypothetical protein OIU76_015587 [Salix suchowensis]